MKIFNYKRLVITIILITVCNISCKKFIEVGAPITSVNGGNVYNEDITASAAINGIYAKMANTRFSFNLSVLTELSGDNLTLFNTGDVDYQPFYQNSLLANSISNTQFWNDIYPYIYYANAAIEGLETSKTLTTVVKQHLIGEAYFLRAFYYFYLVNLYGDVPLALSSDYAVNSRLARTNVTDVYGQIIVDLDKAKTLLDNRYLDATLLTDTEDRTRPNRMAVMALLARVYLFIKNYAAAEAAATEVINQTGLYSSNIPLDQVFLKNSVETIWALQSVSTFIDTQEGYILNLPANGPNNSPNLFYLSESLSENFEENDQRKNVWTGNINALDTDYPFASKYKVGLKSGDTKENTIVLRIAEQYLIRAEARAEQDNVQGSRDDLNVIRSRAGLSEITNAQKEQLRIAILQERRSELFTEWGHRWFDLKRTGKIDDVMSTAATTKGSEWQTFKSLYPVPQSEILLDKALTQNQGYN